MWLQIHSNCIVYLGTRNKRIEGDLVEEHTTLEVVKWYKTQDHTIVTNISFIGMKLYMLLDRDFFAIGTTNKAFKKFSTLLVGFSNWQLLSKECILGKMHKS